VAKLASVLSVAEGARIDRPYAVAAEFNDQRDVCEVSLIKRGGEEQEDGVHDLKKRMTTEIKYKNFLLADCNKRESKEGKLRCI